MITTHNRWFCAGIFDTMNDSVRHYKIINAPPNITFSHRLHIRPPYIFTIPHIGIDVDISVIYSIPIIFSPKNSPKIIILYLVLIYYRMQLQFCFQLF